MGITQPDAATANQPILLSPPALPSKPRGCCGISHPLLPGRMLLYPRYSVSRLLITGLRLPSQAEPNADPRELQPGVNLAQDVSITKLSKTISSDQTDLKSQWRKFIYCWLLDITANKHQRQESLAGDEKSCLVMRGYEPFLSLWVS